MLFRSSCFYLLPSRTWELLIGSFLASIPEKQITKPHVTEILSWGGFIAILCSMLLYNNTTKFPGISALLPCIGTALVIWSNNNNLTEVGKFLTLRPIVFIGLISYSLYLWHWPILVIAKYYMPISNPPIIRILMLIVSMLIAILSWKFVETPFRKRILFKSTLQIFTFAGIATVILLFASISIKKFQGFPARFPTSALQYEKGSTDRAFLNQLILKDALTGNFIEIGLKDKSLPVDIFVWGDSHAMAVMPIIDILCKEYSIRGLAATHSSTMPLI